MSEIIAARRPIVGHPVPVEIDLLSLGLIQTTDIQMIREVAAATAKRVHLDSIAPESTLEQPEQPLQYRITDGTVVASRLPKIMKLYTTEIPGLIKSFIGLEIVPSRFEKSAITLNLVEGRGSRYESHVDSNSITGLLFASSLKPEHGGALRLYYPGRQPLDIFPREGVFLLYDARWVPHEVLELQADCQRISLPMNYFLPTDIETRPEHLDSYIFGN